MHAGGSRALVAPLVAVAARRGVAATQGTGQRGNDARPATARRPDVSSFLKALVAPVYL